MTETEYLLTCLSEECAEIAQLTAKALRFGLSSWHPDSPQETNADSIAREMGDLLTVYAMLVERGHLASANETVVKRDKVSRYMAISRRRGMVT